LLKLVVHVLTIEL